MKLCLVCSSGGHLLELRSLNDLWSRYDRCWVTFPTMDTRFLLSGERVYWAHRPTTRNIPNFFRNLAVAFRVLPRERPDVIVSTGAGVAVPFFYLGRALGMTTVYLESLTRSRDLSLTGRLVYPVASRFLVQWPELAARFPRKVRFEGQIL